VFQPHHRWHHEPGAEPFGQRAQHAHAYARVRRRHVDTQLAQARLPERGVGALRDRDAPVDARQPRIARQRREARVQGFVVAFDPQIPETTGGVGIGGVLEPLQASPTIIEDDCFIGARSEVVEGVVVERGSVLGMGVYLGQSTRIYDRATKTVSYGRVPAGSVVVSGTLPAADGSHGLYAAVIVKRVDEKTRAKTSINELLRSGE
jgi:hypothetical protein